MMPRVETKHVSYYRRWCALPSVVVLGVVVLRLVVTGIVHAIEGGREVLFKLGFMIATQFFFTLCLLGVLISAILVLVFFLCCGPDQNRFLLIIKSIGYIMLSSGISGCIAVIVFACFANTEGWMPGHPNNYFGWSFGLGVVGSVACLVTASLFLTETNIQNKKRNRLKESQSRFEMEHESKA